MTHLSEDVVTNAFIDLESFGDGRKGTSFGVHANASVDTLPQPQWRKRKQVHMTESFQEPPDTDCLEAAMAQNPDELALKVAALEALETLLTVVSFHCNICCNHLCIYWVVRSETFF